MGPTKHVAFHGPRTLNTYKPLQPYKHIYVNKLAQHTQIQPHKCTQNIQIHDHKCTKTNSNTLTTTIQTYICLPIHLHNAHKCTRTPTTQKHSNTYHRYTTTYSNTLPQLYRHIYACPYICTTHTKTQLQHNSPQTHTHQGGHFRPLTLTPRTLNSARARLILEAAPCRSLPLAMTLTSRES